MANVLLTYQTKRRPTSRLTVRAGIALAFGFRVELGDTGKKLGNTASNGFQDRHHLAYFASSASVV